MNIQIKPKIKIHIIYFWVFIFLLILYIPKIQTELLDNVPNNHNTVVVSLATNEIISTGIIQLRYTIPESIPLVIMVPYSMTEYNIKWHQRLSYMNNTHIQYISEHIIDKAPVITDSYLQEKGFRNTWYKLAIWSLVTYSTNVVKHIGIDRIVFLDADTMITGNFTDIFHFLQNVEPNAMAYDTIPPGWFNTGVMVIEPNLDIFKMIQNQISTIQSVDSSDQGFLNTLNHIHPEMIPWRTRLNFSYNAFSWISHIEKNVWEYFKPIQIVHFNTLNDKPYGDIAIREHDLTKNTPFIKSHVELIELWKIWRFNYCNQVNKMNVDDILNYCNLKKNK